MSNMTQKMFSTSVHRAALSQVEETAILPELVGSDKQIAWASDIRMDSLLCDCENALTVRRHADRMGRAEEVDAIISRIITYYSAETSASAWINRKPTKCTLSGEISSRLNAIENDYRAFRKKK